MEKKTAEELKDFFRSEEAMNVYSNTHELLAMANLYNVNIHVFTNGGPGEDSWTTISPDPEMVAKDEAKFGKWIPDISLYHS